MINFCIIRELNQIEGRKKARQYAKDKFDFGDDDFDERIGSLKDANSTLSPSNYGGSPGKKSAISLSPAKYNKLNSSGINESSDYGGPAAKKGLNSILKDNNTSKQTDEIMKMKPTEGNLKKLEKTVRITGDIP